MTVTDVDSATLASMTVQITGNLHSTEDTLAFTNTGGTNFGNITASYAAGTGLLDAEFVGGDGDAAAVAERAAGGDLYEQLGHAKHWRTHDQFQANDGSAQNNLSCSPPSR